MEVIVICEKKTAENEGGKKTLEIWLFRGCEKDEYEN